MRIALHSRLHDGQEFAYEDKHRTVPADLFAALQHAGITDWTIWRSGRDLFHLVDCDDFAAALRALDDDPANARWQETMKAYVEGFAAHPEGAAGLGLRHVWTLTEQAAGDTA